MFRSALRPFFLPNGSRRFGFACSQLWRKAVPCRPAVLVRILGFDATRVRYSVMKR